MAGNSGFKPFSHKSVFGPELLADIEVKIDGQLTLDVTRINGNKYAYIDMLLTGRTKRTADTNGLQYITFNNDTTDANYRYVGHYYNPSSHSGGYGDGRFCGNLGGNATNGGFIRYTIHNPGLILIAYQHIVTFTAGMRWSATASSTETGTVHWENNAEIFQIVISTSDGAGYAAGTRLTAVGYGILTQ